MGFTLPPPPMDVARSLMLRKDAIQAEIDTKYSILSANDSTMNTPLVDLEGFPRADIDVYAVRHARVRIIELRNDLEAITNDIAKALQRVYDPRNGGNVSAAAEFMEALGSSDPSNGETQKKSHRKAFAKVDGVAPGSPAAQAGLVREDLIYQFGTLDATSFATSSLHPLAEFVGAHEDQTFEVLVLRKETQRYTLQLTPRKGWGGRGLLGCHIIPFSSP